MECFKTGLKPDIEQRLNNINDVNEVVKEAIKIERRLLTQQKLRKNNDKVHYEVKQQNIKKIHVCQICRKEGHEADNCDTINKIKKCIFCNGMNHTIENCWKKNGNPNKQSLSCQLCNRNGHTTVYCRSSSKCLKCNQPGHFASQCPQNQHSQNIICQICNKPGHKANTCYLYKPTTQNLHDPYKTRSQLICQICQKVGHTGATCRRGPGTTKECTFCKLKGHMSNECRRRHSGNERSLLSTSADKEIASSKQRSAHVIQTADFHSELIPSTSRQQVN